MKCPVCHREIIKIRVAGIYYATWHVGDPLTELDDIDPYDPEDFWCPKCNGIIPYSQILDSLSSNEPEYVPKMCPLNFPPTEEEPTQSEDKSPESPQEDNQTALL